MVIGPQPRWHPPALQAQMPFQEALPVVLAWPLSAPLRYRLRVLAGYPQLPALQQSVACWCALTYPVWVRWREEDLPRQVAWVLRGIGVKKLAELQTVLRQLLAGEQPHVPTVAETMARLETTVPRKLALVRDVLVHGQSLAQTARQYGLSPTRVRHVLYQTCQALNPAVFCWTMRLPDLRAHRADFGL